MRRKNVFSRIFVSILLLMCLFWIVFPASTIHAESEQTITTDENDNVVDSAEAEELPVPDESVSDDVLDLETQTNILSDSMISAQASAQSSTQAVSIGDTAAYVVDSNEQSDYGRTDSTTRRSYAFENEYGGVSLIDHVTRNDQKYVVIKEYNASHKLVNTKEIAYLLPIFGGFYAGEDANYLVFGQKNADLDDSIVVMSVAKYSKSWKLLAQRDLSGIYTWTPFSSGSCRMEETDDYLYLHTCHLMYNGHQANMFFKFSRSDLKTVNSYYYGSSTVTSNGYVSHSFNQFVKSDGEYLFRVDLGDCYPRGVMIIRNDVSGSFTSPKVGRAYGIGGSQGDNYTGVTLGGVELSKDNILVAGTSVDQTNFSDKTSTNPYNVFVIVGDKAMTTAKTIWLTDYENRSEGNVCPPTLTPLDNDRFLVMWQEIVNYTDYITRLIIIDADGNAQSDVQTIQWPLNSCDPIFCSDGFVRWYATKDGVTTLYELNPYSPQPVIQSVALEPKTLSMSVGESSSDLKASILPNDADQTMTWTSSKSSVVSVDSSGTLKAKSAGTATITVKASNGMTASSTVTVIPAVESLTLNKSEISIQRGKSQTLSASVLPKAADQTVTYSITGDTTVASVDEKGCVTGNKVGTTTITATAYNGIQAVCQVTVTSPDATSISLSETELTLNRTFSTRLIATILPSDASKEITWKSSNESVATVSDGTVRAVEAGKATITATTANGLKATCQVTVVIPDAVSIYVSKASYSIYPGGSYLFTATVWPSGADQKVTWSTSDENIAVISEDGIARGLRPGTVSVTATAANGVSQSVSLTVVYPDATSVRIPYDTQTLTVGESFQLSATVSPINANQAVTWSSSDEKVVSVIDGKITGLKVGEATITASTDNGKTDTVQVTVTKPTATSVSLNKSSTTIVAGSSETLIATIYPTNADQTVTWSSSNTAVATVSNGKITGVKAGSATITAKTSNGKTATCSVTISNAAATKVTLSKSTASLTVGGSTTLTATVSPTTASQTVTWTSSNTGVATVSSGKITAKSVGTVTITAKSADGKVSATCKVTVTYADAASIALSKTTLNLTKGNTSTLTATVYPTTANQNVTWSSSNTSVATVSSGKITAVSAGSATITAKSADGKASKTCQVTVTNPFATSVSLNKSSATIVAGSSETLIATVYPTIADQTVTWTSSNTSVATVSNGKVTGIKSGSTTITAKTSNGKTATCSVTISNAAATKVTLSKSTVNLTIGNSTTLTASVSPSTASQTVTWTSSNTGVATVSGGKITAKSVGSATITAKSADGKASATCKVTVSYADATGVSLSKTSLSLVKGNTATLTATVSPSNASQSVSWASSNTGIATVSNGKITAVAPGNATITVKTANGKTATCKVTVSLASATGVSLNSTTLSLTKGNTSTLTATVSPSNADPNVTWTSSNTNVATVSSGKITAVAPGTAIITAKTANGKTAVCTVTVSYANATSVSLNKTNMILTKGNTENLTATVSPSNANPSVTWSSSNTKVATVSNGKVTAVTPGTATITVKSASGKTATCKVTVNYAHSESISLSDHVLYLNKGQSYTITATVNPSTADQKVTWVSSDPSVAAVSSSGKVTALKAGSTVISATSTDEGAMSTCPVIVNESSSSGSSSGSSGGSASTETVPVYRLYSPLTGEHLYTTDKHEYETLWTFYGWGQEGIGWYAPASGTPVYRLYHPGLKNHLYTTDKNEVSTLCSKYGWQKDNDGEPLFYSGGSQKIYRVYNKGLSGMHHLTTNVNEYNTLPKYGWQQEGAKLSAAALGQPFDKTSYFKN